LLRQPWIPADITLTFLYPIPFARFAAFGAFRHIVFEQ
jgi:hypothetical protein